jgi:hypothetical protein
MKSFRCLLSPIGDNDRLPKINWGVRAKKGSFATTLSIEGSWVRVPARGKVSMVDHDLRSERAKRMDLWDSIPKQWSQHGLGAPGYDVPLRADGMLCRRYHLDVADRQDVIAQALLNYVTVAEEIRASENGLLFVLVRRRACDFLRHRGREGAVLADEISSNSHADQANAGMLQRIAERFFAKKQESEQVRIQIVLREIFDGATFTEACHVARIPRGSQGRYRKVLRQCFRDTLRPGRPG